MLTGLIYGLIFLVIGLCYFCRRYHAAHFRERVLDYYVRCVQGLPGGGLNPDNSYPDDLIRYSALYLLLCDKEGAMPRHFSSKQELAQASQMPDRHFDSAAHKRWVKCDNRRYTIYNSPYLV